MIWGLSSVAKSRPSTNTLHRASGLIADELTRLLWKCPIDLDTNPVILDDDMGYEEEDMEIEEDDD